MKYQKTCLIFIIITCVLSFIMPPAIAEPYAELKEGKVLQKHLAASKKGGIEGAEAKLLINAPPEEVWAILKNPDKLNEILPRVKDIQIFKKAPSFQEVQINLSTMPLMPTFKFTVLLDEKDTYRTIKFKRLGGSFEELYGSWKLEPYKEGTILIFLMYIDFGFYLPGFLRKFGLNRMLPETLKAIKIEAEK